MNHDNNKKLGMVVMGALSVGFCAFVYFYYFAGSYDGTSGIMSTDEYISMPVDNEERVNNHMERAKANSDNGIQRRIYTNESFFAMDKEKRPDKDTAVVVKEEPKQQGGFLNKLADTKQPIVKRKPRVVRKVIKEPKPVVKQPVEQEPEPKSRFYSAKQSRQTSQNDESSNMKDDNTNEIKKVVSDKIHAVIHGDQKVRTGTRVTLRTTKRAIIDGAQIPANTIFYGTALLQGERVAIRLNNIFFQIDDQPFKVVTTMKSVYDHVDGLPGVYTPGSVAQEDTGETASEVIDEVGSSARSSIPLGGLIPKLGKKKVKQDMRPLFDGHELVVF